MQNNVSGEDYIVQNNVVVDVEGSEGADVGHAYNLFDLDGS